MLAKLFRSNGRTGSKTKQEPVKPAPVQTVVSYPKDAPGSGSYYGFDLSSIVYDPDHIYILVEIESSAISAILEQNTMTGSSVIQSYRVQHDPVIDGLSIDRSILKCVKQLNLERTLSFLPRLLIVLHGRIVRNRETKRRWILAPLGNKPHDPIVITKLSHYGIDNSSNGSSVQEPDPVEIVQSPGQPIVKPAPVKVKPERVCSHCGKDCKSTSKFCSMCGTRIEPDPVEPAPVKPAQRNPNKPGSNRPKPLAKCHLCKRTYDVLDGYGHCEECATMRKSGMKPGDIMRLWQDKPGTVQPVAPAPERNQEPDRVQPVKVKPVQVPAPVEPAPVKVETVQSMMDDLQSLLASLK